MRPLSEGAFAADRIEQEPPLESGSVGRSFALSFLALLPPLAAGCSLELARGAPRSAAESRPADAATAPAGISRRFAAGLATKVNGLPVVRLEGTPHEMGFQHGHALAAGIKEGFEEFVLRHRCNGMRARYEQIWKRVERDVEVPARFQEELEGMLEGMQAAGIDLALPMLKRDLGVGDLLVLNSIDHWGLVGCSGFTAWGRGTVDGNVLCARNFDFDVDPDTHAIARLGVILSFEPEDRRAFVSFGFPGMIGAVSGLSEAGVGAFLHVGNGGFGGGDEGRSLPLTMIARLVLEECGPAEAAKRARELLAGARLRNSFLFRLVTDGVAAPPTTVFEVDPSGIEEERLPDETKGEPPMLVTTNHYLTRAAHTIPFADSRTRFVNLEESGKKCLAAGDHAIDPDEAMRGLELVRQQRGAITLHSLVWRPRTQEVWASFSDVDPASGRAVAAPRGSARVKLGQLLGRE
jgi:hypothetical protein